MNTNQTYFSRKTRYRKDEPIYEKDWKDLHWTVQQRLKPNSTTPKPYRETGDSDNRLDNWEEPEGEQ